MRRWAFFWSLPAPGAFVGGIDSQDCFLHWSLAPSRRRLLGVRRPAAGVLGVYRFPPFGLGPSPGLNDACVEALLAVARTRLPRLRILDFADDLRLVATNGEHDAMAADMTGILSLLDDMGIRYHDMGIPRFGFEVDTLQGAVRVEARNVLKGMRQREEIFGALPASEMSARTLLATASFLGFLRWVIPGGFCHLRPGWGAVNESGAMGQWRSGRSRPSALAKVTEQLRNDTLWRRGMLSALPAKTPVRQGRRIRVAPSPGLTS